MKQVANELLIIPVISAGVSESGELILMKRFIEGVGAYVERWPGSVTVLIRQAVKHGEGLDPVIFKPDENRFNVELLPSDKIDLKLRLNQAVAVLGTLASENLDIGHLSRSVGIPVVWVTETSAKTRGQIIEAKAGGVLRRFKRLASNQFRELGFQKVIAKASGVQCNGTPTYQVYKDINHNSLLYFDSRVHQNMVITEAEIQAKAEHLAKGLPLRLAFSGRLTEIKGVDHLLHVADELKNRSIPFTLDIFGNGNLKSHLASEIIRMGLDSSVCLRGVLDFHTELLPTFQQSVDLFLCCHPQGDPSCTYLETMACGVPIIGYANEAWEGLYNITKAGHLIEMGNSKQMADVVAYISSNRSEWLTVALAARNFAVQHSFDKTMAERIAHLKQSAKIN